MNLNHKQFNETNHYKKSGLRRGPSLDMGVGDPDLLMQQSVRRKFPGVPRSHPPTLPGLLAAGATARYHTRLQETKNQTSCCSAQA